MSKPSASITVLKTEPMKVHAELIETLEAAMKDAREAEFSAVMVVYTTHDGKVGFLSHDYPNGPLMLGALAYAQAALGADLREDSTTVTQEDA